MSTSIQPEVLLGKANEIALSFAKEDFPSAIFPSKMQYIIREVHECQSFPIAYISSAMLVAIGVAIGNTHLAQLKQGWRESPMLYLALVGRPGANKSHPLSFAMKPFIDHDYRCNQEYEQAYREYSAQIQLSRKERLEQGKDETPQEPHRKRFLVSDITPEGLSTIHAQNPRGLCLWTDELSAWFKNFNRYNNGSEEQFWLSVFSAKATISDRKGTRSSIFIKRPFISVVGTIQHRILGELARGERAHNGFIDRILFVIPNIQSKARWSKRELAPEIDEMWAQLIQSLISLPCSLDEEGNLQPQVLPFSPEALNELYRWQEENARLCDTEPSDALQSIYCKLEIYIIRFALIIQLMRWVCGEAEREMIDTTSVTGAVALVEYFRRSAVFVQSTMNAEHLSQQQTDLLAKLPTQFTTAEGLACAGEVDMKERAFKDFLSRYIGILFRKERHGEYSKIYT